MYPVFAALSSNVIAALIAAGVSLVVTFVTVFTSPLFRWIVEHDLNRRKAKHSRELDDLQRQHERELSEHRQQHEHALQRAQSESERDLAEQRHEAEVELARRKADIDYEIGQRRALRQEVGAFRGRLIEVASSLNFRLDNMRENSSDAGDEESTEKWLDRQGRYQRDDEGGYYFVSTIYRFMAFVAVANRFERAAVYVDPRYGEPADEQVVFYVRALRWALTDPKLFANTNPPYEQHEATDHFFTDDLRRMCAEMVRKDGELKDMHELEPELVAGGPLQPVLTFFDGLHCGSLKWDRMMAFSLLLKAFLNAIGYERMRSTQVWFDMTAASIQRREIRQALSDWLPRLAIDTSAPAVCVTLAIERADQGASLAIPEPRSAPGDGAEPQA